MPEQYDENLILGYIEGDLSPQDARAFELTLRGDPALRRLATQMRQDRDALRQMPEIEPPVGIMDRVHEHLERSMLLDSAGAEAPALGTLRTHRLGRVLMGLAVAALLLFAATVVVPIFLSTMRVTAPAHGPMAIESQNADASKFALREEERALGTLKSESDAVGGDQRQAKGDGVAFGGRKGVEFSAGDTVADRSGTGMAGGGGGGKVAMGSSLEGVAGAEPLNAQDAGAVLGNQQMAKAPTDGVTGDVQDMRQAQESPAGQVLAMNQSRGNAVNQRMKIQVIAVDGRAAQEDVLRWAVANQVTLAYADGPAMPESRREDADKRDDLKIGEHEAKEGVMAQASASAPAFPTPAANASAPAAPVTVPPAAVATAPTTPRVTQGKSAQAAEGAIASQTSANQPPVQAAASPSPPDAAVTQAGGVLQPVTRETQTSTQARQLVFNIRPEQVPELVGYLNRAAAPTTQMAVVEPNEAITATLMRGIAAKARNTSPEVTPEASTDANVKEASAAENGKLDAGLLADATTPATVAEPDADQQVPPTPAPANGTDAGHQADLAMRLDDLSRQIETSRQRAVTFRDLNETAQPVRPITPAPSQAQVAQNAILRQGELEVEVEIVTAK